MSRNMRNDVSSPRDPDATGLRINDVRGIEVVVGETGERVGFAIELTGGEPPEWIAFTVNPMGSHVATFLGFFAGTTAAYNAIVAAERDLDRAATRAGREIARYG